MRKIASLLSVAIFVSLPAFTLALDPVAPRSERKFGEVLVKSPLPETDMVELIPTAKGGEPHKFKPGETVKVPVGEYDVKVKLQDGEWTNHITVHPTERNDVVVTGYGNLKVNTPSPKSDKVEVTALDGKMIKTFNPTRVTTLPTGTYNVKVIMGPDQITQNNVVIVTNTTREVSASH